MATIDPAAMVQQMEWRYATKLFDPARPVSEPVWAALERVMLLAPSSYGLQPWHFVSVTAPAVRERLRAAAFGQAQLGGASHVVVIASRVGFGAVDVDRHVRRMIDVRGGTTEALAGMRQMILGTLARLDQPAIDQWCRNQAYIALGTVLTAAAILGVDACPMEGFNAAQVNEILNLPARGYTAAVMAAFGHRSADDKYAGLPKVRYAEQDVIERV